MVLGDKQFVAFFHTESLVPRIDVGQRTIHAPFAKCVWVGLCAVTNFLFGDVLSPNSSISQEETLVGRKAVDGLKVFFGLYVLESKETNLQSAVVCKVFAERKLSIGVEVGKNFDVREEVGIKFSTLFKAFRS